MLPRSEDYAAQVHVLDELVLAAMTVSTRTGGVWRPHHYVMATQLYTRLVITSTTLLHILPGSRRAGSAQLWDWPSVAALTRCILELYLSFFYLGGEDLPDDELEFRSTLFRHHSNEEKNALYRRFGSPSLDLSEFDRKLPAARAALTAHPVMQRFTPEQRRRVESWESSKHLSRSDLVARLPFNGGEINLFYRLLSSQVHASPFSTLSQSDERGRGEENETERMYVTWAVWLVRKYLAAAVTRMAVIFDDHYSGLADAELASALRIGATQLARILECEAAN